MEWIRIADQCEGLGLTLEIRVRLVELTLEIRVMIHVRY